MSEETLKGRFIYCIFKAQGYAVWRFEDEDEGQVLVVGALAEIDSDLEYRLYGEYIDHPKYGIEFSVQRLEKLLPTTNIGIVSYLSSELFPGVGPKTAMKIYEHFGEKTLTLIKDDPTILDEIKLSSKVKKIIIDGLNSDIAYEDTFYSLVSAGVSTYDINKIIARYKEKTDVVLKDDPYELYYDIYGIGFKKCDEIAHRLGFEDDFTSRLVALVHHIITELNFKSGDTYTDYQTLKKAFSCFSDADIDMVINEAVDRHKIVIDEERYYTINAYRNEFTIAKYLTSINDDIKAQDIEKAIKDISLMNNVEYDDEQLQAIRAYFDHTLSLVIGGPGTGKTTIIKAIIQILHKVDPTSNIVVVAPTGRAAKRIRELCDVHSETIHALLKWDKESNTFVHDIGNPLSIDHLIIDEFSMVENWLFASLINALGPIKHMCIIGDDHQLPSVGPGGLLHDIIASDMFYITYLKHIHRQAEGSSIIKLCHDILKDKLSFKELDDDIIFIDEAAIQKEELLHLVDRFIEMGYDLDDIQLLAPMYKGPSGIDMLNHILQEHYNPSDEALEYTDRYRKIRTNDKIIQLKNQRDDDVYNGDIGKVKEITTYNKGIEIIAEFDGIFVDYIGDTLANIALAYCISVHKAQGSEYPVVFFIFSKAQKHMLNINLIYTALSRASRYLVIVGPKDVLIDGLHQKLARRKTTLRKRLYDIKANAL